MTAAAVSWVGIGSNVGKVTTGDADNGWTGSLNVDTVNFVEGTASLGEKVSAATVTVQTVNTTDVIGEPFDFSASGGNDGDHIFGWLNIFAAWDTIAAGGFGLGVVDDLASDSSGYWYVGPQSGYLGGWASYVINPSADFDTVTAGTASWTTTGNPSQLSGVDGFGARWKTTVTITGNTDNAFVDAIAVGQGYRITLGDAGSTEGAFSDFTAFEGNTTSGRFGGLREISGILFAKSKLLIGAASGSTNTEFIDSGFTVVWEQQTLSDGTSSAVASGFYEFSVSQGTGTTDVDISSGSLSAVSPHFVDIDLSGVNSVSVDSCVIDRALAIVLDSACTFTTNIVSNSGNVTAGEADLSGSSFLTPTVSADGAAVTWDETISTAHSITELDNTTFSMGSNNHHAVSFSTNVSAGANITLSGLNLNGFDADGTGDSDNSMFEFLATTGTITLTLDGCFVDGGAASESNVTVDTRAGCTVDIVTGAVPVKVTTAESDGTLVGSALVHLRASDGTGPFPYQEAVTIARSGTTATVTHTAHGMASNDKIFLAGITDKTADNGVQTITYIDTNSYSYTTTDSGSTSYTGEDFLIDAQDETNYAASFNGGTGHAVNDVLSITGGSEVTVDAVSSGVITQFTVDAGDDGGEHTATDVLSQKESTGSGTGFSLTLAAGNINKIIKCTFVALEGTTHASLGTLSTSRVYGSDQPVEGWARKADASPYFQQAPITSTVDSVDGMNNTAVMIRDE
jgi:hypothetical protein